MSRLQVFLKVLLAVLLIVLALVLIIRSVSVATPAPFPTAIDGIHPPVEETAEVFTVKETSTPSPTLKPVAEETVPPTKEPVEEVEDIPDFTELIPEPAYNFTEEELDLFARLIHSEGGIESYETQLKIGSVVLNRLDDDAFPDTLREVIYQKNQFAVTVTYMNGVLMIDMPADEEARRAAEELMWYGSVLPHDVQVFFEKSITTGWCAARKPYGTFDHTTFAYIYARGEKP